MNCERYEVQVALWVEGDLEDSAEVEQHVSGCAPCREFTAGLRHSQAALRDLRDEMVDPAVLAAVRMRVLEKVAGRRNLAAWWKFALAPVAVALILLNFPRPDHERLVLPRPAAPTVPEVRATAVARRATAPIQRAARMSEPTVIKILTEDPDVVIYWLVD